MKILIIAYTAKPISLPGESAGEIASDYANHYASKFGPVQKYNQLAHGNIDPQDLWLEQIGVKFPEDYSQSKSAQRALRSYERYQ